MADALKFNHIHVQQDGSLVPTRDITHDDLFHEFLDTPKMISTIWIGGRTKELTAINKTAAICRLLYSVTKLRYFQVAAMRWNQLNKKLVTKMKWDEHKPSTPIDTNSWPPLDEVYSRMSSSLNTAESTIVMESWAEKFVPVDENKEDDTALENDPASTVYSRFEDVNQDDVRSRYDPRDEDIQSMLVPGLLIFFLLTLIALLVRLRF